MFFNSWHELLRIVVLGACGYAALVVILRASGSRTLSQFNAFDFVVTVALGSTLATLLLSKTVSLAGGATAFATLAALQFAVTKATMRWRRFDRLVKSEPRLLVHRGELLRDAMRRARVSEDEIRAALRKHGVARPEDAGAVILESEGSLSVIRDAERLELHENRVQARGGEDAPRDLHA